MSGFEVAGVVLGAFPLAIVALEKYREVAKRMGFWIHLRLEYQKCNDELKFHRLVFTRNLKQLVLPLVADDSRVKALLSDPGGDQWKDQALSSLLEQRLGGCYDLYVEFVKGMEGTVEKLNQELALESLPVQDAINTPKPRSARRLKSAASKDEGKYYMYKVKFMNGERTRTELFEQMQKYNDKLEKLLDSSDKEAQTLQQRASATAISAIDLAICSFWKHANQFFSALSAAWNSCCKERHCARLLLQHRTTKKPEFHVVFAKAVKSTWDIRETKFVGAENENESESKSTSVQAFATSVQCSQPPDHRLAVAGKGALRVKGQGTYTKTSRAGCSISLGAISVTTESTLSSTKLIADLCHTLEENDEVPCCGYLAEEEDCKYYVYRVSKRRAPSFEAISLHQILRGDVHPRPSRRQRYALASIIASSFLQFIETPWLPCSWDKADIIFFPDIKDPRVYNLDQPHLRPQLALSTEEGGEQSSTPQPLRGDASAYSQALDTLGIMLLELCFGALLEDQTCRKRWPTGNNDKERLAFDLMAARDWQMMVNGEAGPDYAQSVAWCLGGNRSTLPNQWRQLMLRNVVQPLRRCHSYLAESEFLG